jgi:hypothetical protein
MNFSRNTRLFVARNNSHSGQKKRRRDDLGGAFVLFSAFFEGA